MKNGLRFKRPEQNIRYDQTSFKKSPLQFLVKMCSAVAEVDGQETLPVWRGFNCMGMNLNVISGTVGNLQM